MTMYSAHVEVDHRGDFDVDQMMDQLELYHASVGMSARGYADAQISLPAETLAQACTTAIAVVSAAFGAAAVACEVLTEAEFDARQGWEHLPDLISVSEAAEILGVTRQAVLQRIGTKSIPAEKIGRDYAIPRAAVVALSSPANARSPFSGDSQTRPRR
jgi:excisionase family DNA binding protein